jgi:hypothetical protein
VAAGFTKVACTLQAEPGGIIAGRLNCDESANRFGSKSALSTEKSTDFLDPLEIGAQ